LHDFDSFVEDRSAVSAAFAASFLFVHSNSLHSLHRKWRTVSYNFVGTSTHNLEVLDGVLLCLQKHPDSDSSLGMSSSMTTATEKTELSRLLRRCAKGSTIAIQRDEKTLAYLVPKDRMEAIAETLDIMTNPKAMKAIRDYRAGKLGFRTLSALDEDQG
jgi:antitoxin YefM